MTTFLCDLPVAVLADRIGLPEREGGNLVEEIDLPEGTAGSQLERALELLVDRLLAAPHAVLLPRLQGPPPPAASLSLRAVGLGPRAVEQLELSRPGEDSRLAAVRREVRAAQGADSLLKVLPVDATSRVPERRNLLTPFPQPSR